MSPGRSQAGISSVFSQALAGGSNLSRAMMAQPGVSLVIVQSSVEVSF